MSGKKGFILCVCQGTCPSFTKMDIFGVLSDIRREKIFDYHKDRSAIASPSLRSKGYNAKYLTDGLIGLAEYVRGERAKDFVEDMSRLSRGNNLEKPK